MTQRGKKKVRIVRCEKEAIRNIVNEENTEILRKITIDGINSNLET